MNIEIQVKHEEARKFEDTINSLGHPQEAPLEWKRVDTNLDPVWRVYEVSVDYFERLKKFLNSKNNC